MHKMGTLAEGDMREKLIINNRDGSKTEVEPVKPGWPELDLMPEDLKKECLVILKKYRDAPTKKRFCLACNRRTWHLYFDKWICHEDCKK